MKILNNNWEIFLLNKNNINLIKNIPNKRVSLKKFIKRINLDIGFNIFKVI